MVTRYTVVPWEPGAITLYWRDIALGLLSGALLTLPEAPSEQRLLTLDPGARPATDALATDLAADLARYLAGEPVTFAMDRLDMGRCGAFQAAVLRAEHAIPRGRLSTYGRIAARIGHPRAARAVGTALGRNPFPVLIPCHRAVHADGGLGGYAGGLDMKRALLALEGIPLVNGKAPTDRFVY
jgi:methylated-DNA-[protein]-cysteine S-methyltransferase